jgi:BTB/POZ domain/BTB And C-terminal Kelch
MKADPELRVPGFLDYSCGTQGLLADLERLHGDHTNTDVVLFVEDGARFHAHSTVLACRCPALVPEIQGFIAKQEGNVAVWPPQSRATLSISLPTLAPCTVQAILRFLYTGRISLNRDNVLDVIVAADVLGVAHLSRLATAHALRVVDDASVLPFLERAVHDKVSSLTTDLIEYIARHSTLLLARAEFCALSLPVVLRIVQQEDLSASEKDIWFALVRWACVRASVRDNLSVSQMDASERARTREHLRPFLRPGYLRILDMDCTTFAKEVEPLDLISEDEVLLKYRFGAGMASKMLFEVAFPLPQFDFLLRIRQRPMRYESTSHPHPTGVSQQVVVSLPLWTRRAHITFDRRCELGRYSDLSFYEDDACESKIASLESILAVHRVSRRVTNAFSVDEPSLSVPLRRFMYTFYAPTNFAPQWGYAFCVRPSIA